MNQKTLGLLGVLFGLGAIGYATYVNVKMDRLASKLDKTIDDLSGDIKVDVSDALVERAVDRAVEREVGITVRNATATVTREIKADIHKEVKASVQSAYSDIKTSVTKEVERQVGNIDISSIRKEVVEKGKQAAVDKLNSSLDEILNKFNDDLHNVSRIYESIANRMTRDDSKKETVFKIS